MKNQVFVKNDLLVQEGRLNKYFGEANVPPYDNGIQ